MMSDRNREQTEQHLPLKAVVFHILFALAEGDSHGYGVIRRVRDRSEGRIHLKTGPFYRHLRKLLDEQLVLEVDARPPDDDPRRGTYYRISELGREVLAAERQRLAQLLSATEELRLIPDEGMSSR